MRIDQNAAKALHAEPLDEPHASHVRREIIHLDGALADPPTVVFVPQVQAQTLDPRHPLVPFGKRLFVHGTDARESLIVKISRQSPGDKTARPGQDDQVVLS